MSPIKKHTTNYSDEKTEIGPTLVQIHSAGTEVREVFDKTLILKSQNAVT